MNNRISAFPWITLFLLVTLPYGIGAQEVFRIGGPDRPWRTQGTTPGGVIDFVERLDEIEETNGDKVFGDASDLQTNWIMPLRLNPDFNISLGVIDRGGAIDVPGLDASQKDPEQLAGMLSGDNRIAFDRKFVTGRIVRNNGVSIRIDLGARFGVDRIVFYPRMTELFPFANEFLRGYELFLNDGLPQNLFASGQPIFTSPVQREPDNRQPIADVQINPQFVRYLQLKSISTLGFEMDEIEVYGRGFVPTASYVSNVIDLGEDMVWGQLDWNEAVAGNRTDSRLEVRVRSGQDSTPDTFFRNANIGGRQPEYVPTDTRGEPLTQETYEGLAENQRGPIRSDAANDWVQWQQIGNGAELTIPAPRRFIQFRIDFANLNLDAGRAVSDLGFEFESPPVDRIVAEIEPPQTAAGQQTTFTYAARISNASQRAGFTLFEIQTPSRVSAIRSAEIQNAAGERLNQALFDVDLATQSLPIRVGDFSIVSVEENHFTLQMPLIVEDGTFLKIVFDAAVFRYGTRFQGRAFADASVKLPLQTESGDASIDLDTDDLSVKITLGSQVVGPVAISPRLFTPNGDGTNDQAQISYTVLHLLEPSPTQVGIYDLAGNRVRQLSSTEVQNGRITLQWDGRDDSGRLVRPGIYLVSVEIRSDRQTERRSSSLSVVY
jgi:hypothetical protein